MDGLLILWHDTGLANFQWPQLLMIAVGCLLLYLAIVREFEPLLLLPIGFGAILANIPNGGFTEPGGILYYIYHVGIESGVFPLLIFLGVGALTDFSSLIANPKTLLLGAAAQFGIFGTLLGAIALNELPGFEFTLKEAGHQVMVAEDGQAALNVAKGASANLVITDVNMPNMDGITLIRELRTLPAYKFTPILTLTTESTTEKKMEGKDAGATGWIVKPFNPEKLLATVNKVLG